MIFQTSLIAGLVFSCATAFNPVVKREDSTIADNQALINELLSAATAVDRQAVFTNNTDFVYDFQNPPVASAVTKGEGGLTVRADRKVFPALIGTGVSMTVGSLGPCG